MYLKYYILVFFLAILASCEHKKAKSDIELVFTPDTLNVGYTYWWSESGPFIGMCGEELSLVLVGSLTQLKEPTNDPGPLYTSQEGLIKIEKVFKIKALGAKTYKGQQYLRTDCFYEQDITIGDRVLVFCYDYEDDYSIPGNRSILKIQGIDDPAVAAIRRYIDADEDPLKIQEDIGLWATHNQGRALQRISKCRKELATTTEDAPLQ